MDITLKDPFPEGEKKLLFMVLYEPNYCHFMLHEAIVKNCADPIGYIHSKFLISPTMNTIPDSEPIALELYKLTDETYYLAIPKERKLNIHDQYADWIFTYPICRSISLFCLENNFTEVYGMSHLSIHHFLENQEDYTNLQSDEIEVYDHSTDSFECLVVEDSQEPAFIMSPLTYNIPKVFTMFGGKGLNILAGSSELGKIDKASAKTLSKFITERFNFKPSIRTIDSTYKEILKAESIPSEAFITKGDDRSNSGVMFG